MKNREVAIGFATESVAPSGKIGMTSHRPLSVAFRLKRENLTRLNRISVWFTDPGRAIFSKVQ